MFIYTTVQLVVRRGYARPNTICVWSRHFVYLGNGVVLDSCVSFLLCCLEYLINDQDMRGDGLAVLALLAFAKDSSFIYSERFWLAIQPTRGVLAEGD